MFNQKKQCRFLFNFLLFTLIKFSHAQAITPDLNPSDIEILPNLVIVNSTSTVNFTCMNYQSSDLPLEASLSKSIPTNEIQLVTNILNKTAIHIQLRSINYVGIFYLLCYLKGEQSKGTRADIIVTAAPGVLQLADKCQVYDREYITCIIRAPTIARAVQNDYPAKFEFTEVSHSPDRLAYRPRVEFLKKESTNEILTFKWLPTTDGEFPDGVRMQIKAILPHFDVSSYYFDMTPVFRITPKFSLRTISSKQIQMNITPIFPSAFCEESVTPSLSSNINRTWTVIESNQNNIDIKNLVSNTLYRVCMKCRRVFSDPDGMEVCQEIKTFSRFSKIMGWFFQHKLIIFFVISLCIIFIILSFILIKKNYKNGYIKVLSHISKLPGNKPKQHRSESPDVPPPDDPVGGNHQFDRSNSIQDINDDNQSLIEGRYLSFAGIHDCIERTGSPKILSCHSN